MKGEAMNSKYRAIPIGETDFIYGSHVKLDGRHFIVPPDAEYDPDCGGFEPAIFGVVEVIPETVGQYADKHDKNGVEIFEGDICKITYDISSPNADKAQYCKATAIISYDDERLCWFWSVCDRYKTVIDIDEYEVTTIVIIGNVHQPELMEQK